MVIKITKDNGGLPTYKGSKTILTPSDVKSAEVFDSEMKKIVMELEAAFLKSGTLSQSGHKKDPLIIWYKVGHAINNFLKKFPVAKKEEKIFWNNLYNYRIINKSIPLTKIGENRNDFKIASLLSKYSFVIVKKVGPWALWREILSYKNIKEDSRILKWVIKELVDNPRTRNETRPLLKAIAARFKRMDTTILNDRELLRKIKEIKVVEGG